MTTCAEVQERSHDEKAKSQHVPDLRWSDAGSRRARGGYERRVQTWRLVSQLLGRPYGSDDGRVHGQALRPAARRKTYEIFAAHWRNVKDDSAANSLNNAKKYVASRTLNSVEWQNSSLIKGD